MDHATISNKWHSSVKLTDGSIQVADNEKPLAFLEATNWLYPTTTFSGPVVAFPDPSTTFLIALWRIFLTYLLWILTKSQRKSPRSDESTRSTPCQKSRRRRWGIVHPILFVSQSMHWWPLEQCSLFCVFQLMALSGEPCLGWIKNENGKN